MKTFAVSSYMLESRFGLENGLKMIKESGFDGVDYDLSYDGPSGNGPCYWETAPLTDFDRIKKAITDAGLDFGQAHAIYPTYHPDENIQIRIAEVLKRQIEVCRYLGCGLLVIHPGYRLYREQMRREEAWDYNFRLFSQLIPALKQYRVKVCIENIFLSNRGKYYQGFYSSAEDIRELLDALNAEAGEECFGFCLDTGHAVLTSNDIGELIRGVGHRLCALHMNDNDGTADQHTGPYAGMLDWERLFLALHEISYKGNMNFELITQNIPDDVMPAMLSYTAAVGDHGQRVIG